MTSVRIFFVGGLISYKALFNWIKPEIYIPTMLGSPMFQILFFAHLGRYSGLRDDSFFVIGNAVQACSMASIYAMTMTVANERYFGTLSALLATPANRFALFMGRALPPIANGLFVSLFGLAVGVVLLDFSMADADPFAFALVLLVTVLSCTCFGMLLGSIGLRARDVFFASNLVYFLMLLFCGVNVPLDALPPWMEAVGRAMPLTHGIMAAREVAAGETLSEVAQLIQTEFLIGAVYGAIAFGLFRFFEVETRRKATLETF
jgi:ABC-2 type transport system permease protein